MTRRELEELSRIRLAEAKALLGTGLSDGAYYLGGYAVECGLKACIAKQTLRHEFPDRKKVDASHSHNLRDLVRLAGMELKRVELARRDHRFAGNWDIVQGWSEQSRYRKNRLEDARALIEAAGERNHGVIAWIRQHW